MEIYHLQPCDSHRRRCDAYGSRSYTPLGGMSHMNSDLNSALWSCAAQQPCQIIRRSLMIILFFYMQSLIDRSKKLQQSRAQRAQGPHLTVPIQVKHFLSFSAACLFWQKLKPPSDRWGGWDAEMENQAPPLSYCRLGKLSRFQQPGRK